MDNKSIKPLSNKIIKPLIVHKTTRQKQKKTTRGETIHVARIKRFRGIFQMEVIIPIPL